MIYYQRLIKLCEIIILNLILSFDNYDNMINNYGKLNKEENIVNYCLNNLISFEQKYNCKCFLINENVVENKLANPALKEKGKFNNNISYSDILSKNKQYINELNEEKKKVIKLTKELNSIKEQMIAVNFVSAPLRVNCPMFCKSTDILSKLEKELYTEYPELKHKNIYFIANGKLLNNSDTLEQNKIKNRNIILIEEKE